MQQKIDRSAISPDESEKLKDELADNLQVSDGILEIRQILRHKKRFLDLLLLADEQESMINLYLERGEMFALYDQNILRTICVVTNEGDKTVELKNIATDPQYQKLGYGKN